MAPLRKLRGPAVAIDAAAPDVELPSLGGAPPPDDAERRCLEHVKRTSEYLAALGLHEAASAAPRRLQPVGAVPVPEAAERPQKRARTAEDPEEAAPEVTRAWLLRSRAAITSPGLGGPPPGSPAAWRAEAVRRWGEEVPAADEVGDWATYVCSRLSTPPPPSPMNLMQETYAYDPWRLLVACVLMARISSERVKTETIAAFFGCVASPSSLLGIEGAGAQASGLREELQRVLRPLGLVDNRLKTLLELSRAFLRMPSFSVGSQKNVNKIYGCGAFAIDSYSIFCRGHRLPSVADASCQAYLDWWSEHAPAVEEEEATSPLLMAVASPSGGRAKVRVSAQGGALVGSQQPSLVKFFKQGTS